MREAQQQNVGNAVEYGVKAMAWKQHGRVESNGQASPVRLIQGRKVERHLQVLTDFCQRVAQSASSAVMSTSIMLPVRGTSP